MTEQKELSWVRALLPHGASSWGKKKSSRWSPEMQIPITGAPHSDSNARTDRNIWWASHSPAPPFLPDLPAGLVSSGWQSLPAVGSSRIYKDWGLGWSQNQKENVPFGIWNPNLGLLNQWVGVNTFIALMKMFLLTQTLIDTGVDPSPSAKPHLIYADWCFLEGTVQLCLPSLGYLESGRLFQLMLHPKLLNQKSLFRWCVVKSLGCNWLLKRWTCHRIRSVSDGPINFMQIKANQEGINSLCMREAKLVLWLPSC